MSNIIQNFIKISDDLSFISPAPTIIAVSKTFPLSHIQPLIQHGHRVFGENKVQEAKQKWSEIKNTIKDLELHLIGGLQSNNAKEAVKLFDYINSVDSLKLVKELAKAEETLLLKRKYFIQVNIGNEKQKNGVSEENLSSLIESCNSYKLKVVGFMCIPPFNSDAVPFFLELKKLNKQFGLPMMSMGMSSDFLEAAKLGSTHVRIGSKIFGSRASQ